MTAWTPATVRDVLAAGAGRGDAEALVTERARLSYRGLVDEAWEAAGRMHALGLRRGDHVGLLMGNDASWLALFYGAALIGAVTVPINTRSKPAELGHALRQAECRALFLADRFLGIDVVSHLRAAEPAVDRALPGAALPRLRHAVILGEDVPRGAVGWSGLAGPARAAEGRALQEAAARVTPDDLLLIQFTSGTTARPKGVMLTHDGMLRNAWAAGTRIGLRADDRYFNCRPFFHVAGSTLSALMALVLGACLVTLPTFEAGAALATMARERCTMTSGNDTIFQMLLGHPRFDPGALRLRGGWAAAGPETMRRIVDVLGAREICWAYGLSEASPNVAMSDYRDPVELRIAGLARPHEGVEVRIADPDAGRPLPAGAPGEIQVRGWSVTRGYYNDPAATAGAFTPDGWLRTGDLGALGADGRLRMVGRLKDVLRVGGENVAPAEVEEVLLQHPAVETAQVVGVPDPRLGEVPAAFVRLRAGATAAEEELIAWVRARCAGFRVPRYVRIVESFDAIGMTASGKVQKARLREHAVRELGLA
jgi:fatty-acyl-CoA synthase